jgi:uncharacterized protein YyaL (SSP411 family)
MSSSSSSSAGLMISAYARASEVLGDKRYAESAGKCAQFIRDQLYDDQEAILYRTWRDGRGNVRGFSEDYSFMVQALLGNANDTCTRTPHTHTTRHDTC